MACPEGIDIWVRFGIPEVQPEAFRQAPLGGLKRDGRFSRLLSAKFRGNNPLSFIILPLGE